MELPDAGPHAAEDDAAADLLLRALADATRRRLLDRLRAAPGLTQHELLVGQALTRQALAKHLAVLEGAGLVVALWRGREKLHYLNPAPLQALPARWTAATPQQHAAAAAALNAALAQSRQAAIGNDLIAALLAAPPPPTTRVATAAGLDAARSYVAASLDAVRQLAAVLPADDGYERAPDGGFSLAEHIWHLADLETLGWQPRFERVLQQPHPRLAGVDGDALARAGRYRQRPWRGAARRFVASRRRTLRDLAQLDASWLPRPLLFANRPASVGDLLAAMVAHDHEHRTGMAALWSGHEEAMR